MKAALFLVAVLAVFAAANAQTYCGTDDGSLSFRICKNVVGAVVGAGKSSDYSIPTCMQGGNNIFNGDGAPSVIGNISAAYTAYNSATGISSTLNTTLYASYANNTKSFADYTVATNPAGMLITNITTLLKAVCTSFPSTTYSAPTAVVSQSGTVVASSYLSCTSIALDTKYDDSFSTACSTAATTSAGVYTCTGAVSSSVEATGCTDAGASITYSAAFRAPPGASVVTPLTTVIQYVARNQGLTSAKASAAVAKALGICTGTCSDTTYAALLSLDPVSTLASDKTSSTGLNTLVYTTIVNSLAEAMFSVGAKYGGVGKACAAGLHKQLATYAYSARRRSLLAAGDLTSTLKDSSQLTTIMTAASSAGGSTASASVLSNTATLNANIATLVVAAAASGGDVTSIMTSIAKINVAAAAAQTNVTGGGDAPSLASLNASAQAATVNTSAIAASASAATAAIALVAANKAKIVPTYLKFSSASTSTISGTCTTAKAITISGTTCTLNSQSQTAAFLQTQSCSTVAGNTITCYYKSIVSNPDSVATTMGSVTAARRLLAAAATASSTGFVSSNDINTATTASTSSGLTSTLSTSTGQTVALLSSAATITSGASAVLPSFAALLAAIAALLML